MSTSTRSSRSSAPKIVPPVPLFCLCRGPDEPNRSMIGCDGGCNDWFHWDCISLDETGYEDILEYICPNCEVSTGKSTTRQNIFQSPPEPSSGSPLAVDSPAAEDGLTKESTTSPKKKRAAPEKKVKAESKDDQEHVEEEEPKASSSALPTKSRSTSISTPSTKPTKSSSSSKPHARRTSSHSTSAQQPFVPIPSDPKDDPTRKVCLEGVLSVLLPLLEDAEKAKAYAQKLEELVWTAEEGGTTVGRKKYQDRMRSLRFNVSKSDRTELRSGISNGTISPERLSKMNSNDLANPTSQAAYTAASEASLRLRTIPTSSKATPLILHNHKGVVEVSDSREEMEREEENQRRQEEVERIKRKREREYEGSVQGVLEQAKRRRSETEEVEAGEGETMNVAGNESESIPPFVVDTTTPSSSNSHQHHLENEKLDSDFAMEFNEFLTDDVLGNDEDDDPSLPTSSFDNHHDDDDADLLGNAGGGGGSPFRAEEDLEGEVDEAMFDFFVDEPKAKDASKEVGKVDKGKRKEVVSDAGVVISEEEKARKVEEELSQKEVVWVGEIINPEIPLHGTLHARQVGGPPLTDLETWSTALLPKSSYAIIGRVPIEASRKFLLQMHLTPTKELVVVSLEGEGEEGGKSEKGLREFLVKRGRDALVQPHDKNALPVGGARDMYIVVLPSSDPLPEFLEIMDTNRLPAIRTKDYLLGVFIRARSYPVAASSSSSRSSKSKPTPTPTAAPAQPPKSTTPPPSLPVPTDPRKQRAAPSPIPSIEPPPAPAPPPATAPLPPPPTLPLPLFDPSSIASILAGLTGVIPSIATLPHQTQAPPPPLPTIYHPPPPPPANYHLPPPPLHLQHPSPPPPPSSNSPYHQPPQQQYQPPPQQQPQQQGSYRYDASSSNNNHNSYPAPPPAGPDWYTPPSSSAPPPPQNGYGGGGGQNGYTPQQQQQQYGRPNEYERRESGGGGDGGRGGRGGRGGGRAGGAAWDAGRGSDQGWGRRGGRGG